MKKNIQNYFGNLDLQRRLLTYFILVCIIPLITIGSFSIYQSLKSTRSSAIQFSEATLNQVKTRLETTIDLAKTTALQMADNATVQLTLRKPMDSDLSKQYSIDLSMDTYLNYESTYLKELYGIYVIGDNKSKYKSAYNSFYQKDLTNTLWYQRIVDSSDPIWFASHKESFAVQTSGQSFVSCGIRVNDKASSNVLGVVLIDIELEQLENVLLDSFGNIGQVMIIDDSDQIIASSSNMFPTDSQVVLEAIESTKDVNSPEDNMIKHNAILLHKKLSNNSWRLVGIIPTTQLLRDSYISIGLLLALLIFITLLTYYISKIITSTITKPISHMIDLMKEVESGNLDVKTEVFYEDEIGKLSISFNKMVVKVKTLMTKSVEEESKMRRYELKALQSQINPHFLYNTLDSVVWLARMQRYEDIVAIINSMTKLFRISLSRGKDIITIEDEISHVTNYLQIQKFRYKTHFDYHIDVPKKLHHYQTLKLILQPLVENAIYHGIKVKREGGDIYITGVEKEETIVFTIKDTGVGMDAKTLDAIHNAFETKEEASISMYGIRNVNERLGIFFGAAYGIRYESELGVGTTAYITIPKYIGDESNVKNDSY